jgi:hypothetical protein
MKALVIFGGFADDSQGVLAAVYRLAFVGCQTHLGFPPLPNRELPLGHGSSLALSAGESVMPVEIKRPHYRAIVYRPQSQQALA